MARRYDESCLQVYIYKTNKQKESLELTPSDIRESIVLNTVTSVETSSEVVYDEGDTRPIRLDTVLTLQAIITQGPESEFGDTWEFGVEVPSYPGRIRPVNGDQSQLQPNLRGGNFHNNKLMDTASMITFLTDFLTTPGIVVDLGHYPSAVTSIIPSKSITPMPGGSMDANAGLLVDSFNGPKPLTVKFKPLSGGNDFILTWEVKFSVSMLNYENAINSQVTRWSSELRLDIDEDGDVEIQVSGTVYAPNPKVLYQARKYLSILVNPQANTFVAGTLPSQMTEGTDSDKWASYVDVFAQVNGFTRKTIFNVDKSGRSAMFSVTYTPVKSNSALPFGIKAMDFTHEISSSLFGEDVFQGAGFVSWKSSYAGKIRIPPRMNANYAWYVIFYLIAQKTRKLKKFTTVEADLPVASALGDTFKDKSGDELTNKIKGIPLYIRMKHNHYKREVDFNIDYLVLCPLEYVFSATCLLERVNSDYDRRFNMPREADNGLSLNYRPAKLSQQWLGWLRTTLPEYGFDPYTTPNVDSTRGPEEFYDNSGVEIVDGGHEIDPFVPGARVKSPPGFLRSQLHAFVTTIVDPHEDDPDYSNQNPDEIKAFYLLPKPYAKAIIGTPGSSPSVPDLGYFNPGNFTNQDQGQAIFPPAGTNLSNDRLKVVSEDVDPRFTWVTFNESYIVRTTHPTLPTEALRPIDETWHSETKLFNEFVTGPVPSLVVDPSALVSAKLNSGMHGVSPSQHPETGTETIRKTYAVKASRYYVTVKGYAVRAKYPITCPTVIAIAGHPAIKVGDGRFMLTPQGLNGSMPVYTAAWEQTYTIDASVEDVDILKNLESTGASVFYS